MSAHEIIELVALLPLSFSGSVFMLAMAHKLYVSTNEHIAPFQRRDK